MQIFSTRTTRLALLLPLLLVIAALLGFAASPRRTVLQSPLPSDRLAAAEQQFAAAGNDVGRLVAIYRMEDIRGFYSPAAMLAALQRLDATPSLSPLLAAQIEADVSIEDVRGGQGAAAAAIWRKLGEVETWQAIGPFDNANPAQIAKQEGPEQGVNLSSHYPGKQRDVSWRSIPFAAALGDVELTPYFTPAQSSSVYLASWVHSDSEQDVALRLREAGSTRIWVNGKLVFDEQAVHSAGGFDQHAVAAHFAAGWNEILAKIGNSESTDWRFALRVTNAAGVPIVLANDATPHPRGTATAAAAAAIKLADLTQVAKDATTGVGADAQGANAFAQYAWVLTKKRNFNAGDHDDANAFLTALADAPTNASAARRIRLDFAEHDSDQSRRYRNLEQLLTQDGNHDEIEADAHIDLGFVELDRQEYWPARDDFDAVWQNTGGAASGVPPPASAVAQWPKAALGELECYLAVGIRPQVLQWETLLQQADQQQAAIATSVAAALHRVGVDQDSLHWYVLAHASDAGNFDLTVQLADAQRRQGDWTQSLESLQQLSALDGEYPSLDQMISRAQAGLGRDADALATMQRAVKLNPDDPAMLVAQGELQSRLGHSDASVQAWQSALNLNPQDADLRDRLQLAHGGESEESFEKTYVVDAAKAIADYAHESSASLESGPVVIVADTTVTNIFPSGNTGRYVQQVFRVNNRNGADSLSTYAVTYDPGVENVRFLIARVIHADGTTADAPQAGDQPISESVGYETFYNVRNKYVEMPSMRPGDFVEIAYRVLPTTLESLYGDYYGDLEEFGSGAPTLFQQFVVLTPANKSLYFKAVRFGGPAHPDQKQEQKEEGGKKIYRWTATRLPADIGEPSAPPSVEQVPYVAVSSFETWTQFADWYTELTRDTFVVDDELKQTVQGLVQGKTDAQSKVEAIYRYVIQNTHYVALEFGIHGYRPYPVMQVFHRRFGDCKDKASLLIAMLNQAGIPAEFVLTRTRDRGVIDSTIPSVADFDHAIVYVPELHQYLDGTSEFNGAKELPDGDQRAFVLRIHVQVTGDAQSVEAANGHVAPEVTPDLPPSDAVTNRVLTGDVNSGGDLHFLLHWEVSGGRAPELRAAMELPERRAGALQALLHDRLPGITVLSVTVQNENDWDRSLVLEAEGTIPRFATVNGNTMLVPRQFLPSDWLPRMASLAQRKYDVLSDPPEELHEKLALTLPEGYEAVVPPSSASNQPFAQFDAGVQANGRDLTMTSTLVTKQSLIPPATYPPYRSFWTGVDSALTRPVTATKTDAPNSNARGGGGNNRGEIQ